MSALWDIAAALVASSTRGAKDAAGRRSQTATGGDYAALKRSVKERGLLARQPVYYTLLALGVVALLGLGVVWVALTRHTPLVWAGAPLLALCSGQLVLLGHDAAHHAVFATPGRNAALAILTINALSGGSAGWWAQSHNAHHARSNDPDLDPDIDYPFFAFSQEQAAAKDPRLRPLLARQHVLAFLLMGLVGLTLRVYSLTYLAQRWRDRWHELIPSLAFYALYPALLVHALCGWRGVLFMLAHQVLFGFYLGSITAVNHWAMPMPRGRLDFTARQVLTSRNVAGGWLSDLWFGGLNRQIEHHLFPTMPRNNLKRVRPLVGKLCAARGIVYHEVPLRAAYREIYTALWGVARQVGGQTAR
jgi:fatty acid desaturase